MRTQSIEGDVKCPYCGDAQDINHDDGYGYEEDQLHEQECSYCHKIFTYETSTHFYYDVHKADCLNGGEHKFEKTNTIPPEFARLRCKTCSMEKDITEKSKKFIFVGDNDHEPEKAWVQEVSSSKSS